MRCFDTWEIQDLEDTFGLTRYYDYPALKEWTEDKSIPLTKKEEAILEDMRQELFMNVEYWNEEELKIMFIGALLKLIHFRTSETNLFFDRRMVGKVQEIEMGGKVDMLVAKGRQKPKMPYLILHEYKQERRKEPDPLAQLLSEMLVAQELNGTEENYFYGAYIVGRLWFFVVFKGREYAVSDAYSATGDDIFQITRILKKSKLYIEQILAASKS